MLNVKIMTWTDMLTLTPWTMHGMFAVLFLKGGTTWSTDRHGRVANMAL